MQGGDGWDEPNAAVLHEAAAYLRGMVEVVTRFPDLRNEPIPEDHRRALWDAINNVAGVLPPDHFIEHILPRLRDPASRAQAGSLEPVTYWDIVVHGLPMAEVLDAVARRSGPGGSLASRRTSTRDAITVRLHKTHPPEPPAQG